jgi:hypothetical protein
MPYKSIVNEKFLPLPHKTGDQVVLQQPHLIQETFVDHL